MSKFKSFIEGIKYAFTIPDEEKIITKDEEVLLTKIAYEIVKRRLTAIAITFLESVKNLNFISSQAMLFFRPIVQSIFPTKSYDILQGVLEKRGSIEYLIQKIEEINKITNT